MLRVSVPEVEEAVALPDRRTPSISTTVPKSGFPISVLSPLNVITCAEEVRLLNLLVCSPGKRLNASDTLTLCKWSSAVRPNVYAVVASAVFLSAVTVTSFRANVCSERYTTMFSLSFLTSSCNLYSE